MTSSRTFWVTWCLAWAAGWFFVGWLVLPLLNIGLAAMSVLAIWLPVGTEETCELCRGRYPAKNMLLHMQYRHGEITR